MAFSCFISLKNIPFLPIPLISLYRYIYVNLSVYNFISFYIRKEPAVRLAGELHIWFFFGERGKAAIAIVAVWVLV